jgi:hypothetical protein
VQSELPLFDTPPSPAAPEPKPIPKQPTLHEDTTFARLVRAMPPGSLAKSRPQLQDLARRLVALRAELAARAEGGNP